MHRWILASFAAATLVVPEARAQGLKTDDDKTLYALGLMVGQNLKGLALKPAELETVKKGITDSALGTKPKVELNDWRPKVSEFARKKQTAAAEKAHGEAQGFLEEKAKEAGAQKLPSGVIYRTLTPGKGPSPAATDKVKVNYEGKLVDGTIFDSSYQRGQPISFPLGGVIKCWTEGVQKMKVGETAQLVCPSEVAYGSNSQGPIPPNSTLIFKVELIGIEK